MLTYVVVSVDGQRLIVEHGAYLELPAERTYVVGHT